MKYLIYFLIVLLNCGFSCDKSCEIDYVIYNNLDEEIIVKRRSIDMVIEYQNIPSKWNTLIYNERGRLRDVDEMMEYSLSNHPDTIEYFNELILYKITNNNSVKSDKNYKLRQYWVFKKYDDWNGEYKLIIDEDNF